MAIRILWVMVILSMLAACGGGDGKAQVTVATDDGGQVIVEVSGLSIYWQAPTENTDGSPLDPGDLKGYTIYYGEESRSYTNLIQIDTIGIAEYLIEEVPLGTYYVAMTATNTDNIESTLSNEIQVVVD